MIIVYWFFTYKGFQPIYLHYQGILVVSFTKGLERGVRLIISRDTVNTARGVIAKFDLLNLVQIQTGTTFLGHLVEHLVLILQGHNFILYLLLGIVEIIYSIIAIGQTSILILIGLLGGRKCVALINTLRLVPALWITVIIAKDTLALYAAMTSGILPSLTRFGIIFLAKNPGACFIVRVSIFRLLSLTLFLG